MLILISGAKYLDTTRSNLNVYHRSCSLYKLFLYTYDIDTATLSIMTFGIIGLIVTVDTATLCIKSLIATCNIKGLTFKHSG